MSHIEYESLIVAVTTSTSATSQTAGTYTGFVHAIDYAPSTSTPYSTDANFAITSEKGGLNILTIDNPTSTATYYPRAATATSTGATSTGSALVPLHNERLVVTISNGSSSGARSGTFEFFIS